MTIVCVDDHPIMLNGLLKNIQQILPDAIIGAFTNAEEAIDFILPPNKDNLNIKSNINYDKYLGRYFQIYYKHLRL